MNDQVTESFKCSSELSRQITLLAQLGGFEGKSEYLRHLIISDLNKQREKAALYKQLCPVESNTKGDEVINEP